MIGFSLKNLTFVLLTACFIWFSNAANSQSGGSIFNVLNYGAKGDGLSDDKKVSYLFLFNYSFSSKVVLKKIYTE